METSNDNKAIEANEASEANEANNDDNDENSSDTAYKSEAILFAEHEKALSFISAITSGNQDDDEADDDKNDENDNSSNITTKLEALASFRRLMDRYLEAPTLLDPYLVSLVAPLGEYCVSNKNPSENRIALSAIYTISKVRGRKRIVRFLPHSVDLMEPVVLDQLVRLSNVMSKDGTWSDEEPPLWESVYILWMWMELLSLVPFRRTVVLRESSVPLLIELAQSHLAQAGPVRDTAATCLASWLARQDMQECRSKFYSWSRHHLTTPKQDNGTAAASTFLTLGVLQTLTSLLKVGPRDDCNRQMEFLWKEMLELTEQQQPNMLIRKYVTKWMSRMGCAHMPPRIASWRYQRGGRRNLLENLQQPNQQQLSKVSESESRQNEEGKVAQDEDLFHVPDAVEDVMGHLIHSLQDRSTVVRWSAAKGIGRLTERLPLLCAHDVLDALIRQLTRNTNGETNDLLWHGSCLALGELARRGLLLPARLNDVMEPIIIPAIHFDIRKGQTSVGAHVRDAACYTYWAFARAYSQDMLKPHVARMSQSLVVASLFDREINCRRAASAAFQESVGRQGAQNFPHGIEILTAADYFTLGNRVDSFTTIAASIAPLAEYQRPIIDHLYTVKLFHWDIAIRELASKSLHGIALLDAPTMQETVIPVLLEKSTNSDLFVRHGAVLGLAEIVLALTLSRLPDHLQADLSELVVKLEKLRLYRGRGGEVMRAAVCRFVECISLANLPLTVKQQVRLLDSIDENLRHPNEVIQKSAASALAALTRFYFPVRENGPSDRLQKRVVDKYVHLVTTSSHPAETRGYALGLGALPKKLLAPSTKVLDGVIDCLVGAARFDATVGLEGDAETRRNAIQSLMSVAREVGFCEDKVPPTIGLSGLQLVQIFESFLLGLQDYNTDRRGDVGSWSRLAAITGLEQLIVLCAASGVAVKDEIAIQAFGGLLKQLSEKLDNVRSHAGTSLERLLTNQEPLIPNLTFREQLAGALQISHEKNWSDAKVTYKIVLKAADISDFFTQVVSGIVVSVGALTESVSKEAEKALISWVRDADNEGLQMNDRVERLGQAFVDLFCQERRKRRVILPLLKTMENLLTRGLLDHLRSKQDMGFASSILECVKIETRGCTDIYRLLSIAGVVLGLLCHWNDNELNRNLLEFFLGLLAHEFPRVRKYSADNLYVRLLEDPSVLPIQENEAVLFDILLEGHWESDMSQDQVNQLCSKVALLMGVSFTPRKVTNPEKPHGIPKDEFDSYASLVKEALS